MTQPNETPTRTRKLAVADELEDKNSNKTYSLDQFITVPGVMTYSSRITLNRESDKLVKENSSIVYSKPPSGRTSRSNSNASKRGHNILFKPLILEICLGLNIFYNAIRVS